MISWTVTARPTVAATLITEERNGLNSFEAGATGEVGFDNLAATEYTVSAGTFRTSFLSNGNRIEGATVVGSEYITLSGGAIATTAQVEIYSADVGGVSNYTGSYDGQFTLNFGDGDGPQYPTSESTTLSGQTSTTCTTTADSTEWQYTTIEWVTGGTTTNTNSSTIATTRTTSAQSAIITTMGSAESTSRITTSVPYSVKKWNGETGQRATWTVVVLDQNELLLSARTSGFGETANFLTTYTAGRFTLKPSWQFVQGATTAPDQITSQYTTVTNSSTLSCSSTMQISLTPSAASKLPSTTTSEINVLTTSSSFTVAEGATFGYEAPTRTTDAWTTSTASCQLGTMTFQKQLYTKTITTIFITDAVENTPTWSTAFYSDYGNSGGANEDYGIIRVVQYSSYAARSYQYSTARPLQLHIAEHNDQWRTAASVYEGRAIVSNVTEISRDIRAAQMTFSPAGEVLAAQTAIVQTPATWSYVSSNSSITNSANPNGLSQTIKTGSLQTTTKSGAWVLSNNPVTQQSTEYFINPIVTAPTETASVFVPPGWYFTSDNSGASGTVFVDNVQTIAANPNRVASSAMPVFSVGDGQWFVVSQRNYVPASL